MADTNARITCSFILKMLRLTVFVIAVLVTAEAAYRRVCYHTNWSQYRQSPGKFLPENIDPNLCTHINYAFAKLNGNHLAAFEWNDESTPWSKGMYERFDAVKKQNPSVKSLISVGGWNMASAPFTKMVSTSSNIMDFATSSIKFIRNHNFDGLDIDWEYPAKRGSPPGDKAKFVELVKVLRQEFEKEATNTGNSRLLLSAGTGAGKDKMDDSYDWPELIKYFDYLNVMTYDLHGPFETHTDPNAPLHSRPGETGDDLYLNDDFAITYMIQKGVPPSMINLGLPLYGHSFTLSNPSNNGVMAPISGAGQAGQYTQEAGYLSYYEICKMIPQGTVHRLPHMEVPYLVKGNQWVGYDDVESLKKKVDYAKSKHLGGIMVWALGTDDFSGSCGQGKYPLLTAINNELAKSGTSAPAKLSTAGHVAQTTSQVPPVTNAPAVQTHQPVTPSTTVNAQHTMQPTVLFSCGSRTSGFYANPSSCTSYYICAGKSAWKVDCAVGLKFNPATLYCDYPSNVNCQQNTQINNPVTSAPTARPVQQTMAPMTQTPSQTPRPTTNTPATQGYDPNFCKSRIDGTYSDPNNCGQFYQCSFGLAFHEPCPPGLAFNGNAKVCDYAINVPSCTNYHG